MAMIKIKRKHSMGQKKACEKVETIAQKLQKDLDAEYHWEGSALVFSRTGASGKITVRESDLDVEVKLGMLLSALKGKVEQTLNEELDKQLSA